jgi:carboxymethylenebutenolidase
MKLTALLLLVLCLASPVAMAQDWAKQKLDKSPRHLEWVTVKHGKRQVKCFIAYPEVKQKAPVVVLIHEIFGLSDWVRSTADQLAAEGYIAIAPDLLSGMGPHGGDTSAFVGEDDVRKAVSALPQQQIDADMQAVVNYTAKIPAANGKMAVAGFCWGGGQVYNFANGGTGKNLSAAFVFYGKGPDDQKGIANIQAPVLGFYAENDERVDATIDATKDAMKKLGKRFEPVIYKGAGHGFMRAGEAPEAKEADKTARSEAWARFTDSLKTLR